MAGKKSDNYRKQIEELWESEGDADARMSSLRQAAALADTHGDVFAGMISRLELLEVAAFNGYSDDMLVHFAWCIGKCEEDPELFEKFEFDILWRFKWVMSEVPEHPEVTRKQVDEVFQQMEKYYDKAGVSHRAIHGLRAQTASNLGDFGKIANYRDAWMASPKDGMEDCAACETSSLMQQYLEVGEFEKGVEAAKLLIAGRQKCGEQPERADAFLLVPLFRLGNFELARRLEKRSFKKVRGNRNLFEGAGCYLAYHAATDQLSRGLGMFETLARDLPRSGSPWERMIGLKGARMFLKRMEAAGHKTFKARISPDATFYRPEGEYETAAVIKAVEKEMKQIASAFDKRNGNRAVSKSLTDWDDLLEKVHPLDGKK